ncbi:MAG: DMT family transporter [Clostridiales bacterium]|nr:DMT family transporter [Clostridiales bacterium]
MNRSLRANLLLTLTALIWGVAFVAQDVAANRLGPFSFNGLRMALAALALVPVVLVMERRVQAAHTADEKGSGAGVPIARMSATQRKTLLAGGLCCGVMLTLGSVFQQLGISMGTGAGKAGFITALYIVLVPLIGLFTRKRVRRLVWVAVALSAVGLYLLCVKGGFSIDPGDGMLMLCALCFSGHILVVDFFSRKTDCVKMSCIQFAVVSVLCLLGAACTEQLTWQAVRECAVPILYAGVMSGAMGYTLQIVAQKDTDPTIASLLMSLESVFAVLAGWIILGDRLSARELLGCLFMMAAIVLAQLPGESASRRKTKTANG